MNILASYTGLQISMGAKPKASACISKSWLSNFTEDTIFMNPIAFFPV
jgi:hypothetical protein